MEMTKNPLIALKMNVDDLATMILLADYMKDHMNDESTQQALVATINRIAESLTVGVR
jgi:ferritin